MTTTGYSFRSPGVKRLMKEAQELKEATDEYYAQPTEDNLFEWHFTVRGPVESVFEDGIYHGKIILPAEYPMKPPSIIWITPSGRFETNSKICLSISAHHPESWQPSWSIRTALLALIAFFPTPGRGALGSLDFPDAERKKLAAKSCLTVCPQCGPITKLLKPRVKGTELSVKDKEEMERVKQITVSTKTSDDKEASIDKNSSSTNETSTPSIPNDLNASCAQSQDHLTENNTSVNNVSPAGLAQAMPTPLSVMHAMPYMCPWLSNPELMSITMRDAINRQLVNQIISNNIQSQLLIQQLVNLSGTHQVQITQAPNPGANGDEAAMAQGGQVLFDAGGGVDDRGVVRRVQHSLTQQLAILLMMFGLCFVLIFGYVFQHILLDDDLGEL